MRYLLLLAALALLIPACGATDSNGTGTGAENPPAEGPPSDVTPSDVTPSDLVADLPDVPEIPGDVPEVLAAKTTTVTLDVAGMT